MLDSNTIEVSFMFLRIILNNMTALGSLKTQFQSSLSLPVLLTACPGSLFHCIKSLRSGIRLCKVVTPYSTLPSYFFSVFLLSAYHTAFHSRYWSYQSILILFHYICHAEFLSWNTHLNRSTKWLYPLLSKLSTRILFLQAVDHLEYFVQSMTVWKSKTYLVL